MAIITKELIERELSAQKEELREFIKDFVKKENLEAAISIHNRYILGVPESLSVFSHLVLDPTTREEVRSYFSLVIAYVIEPENYLRKNVPKTIDSLLNAYVIHASLEIALRTVNEEKLEELSEKLEFLEPIFQLNPIVRSKIPDRILNKQDIIINYLDKLLDVKASVKERPIYILPPA